MYRPITALIAAGLALTACDINEGPKEELNEAIEAAQRGERPSDVADELQDVTSRPHEPFDNRLREIETWLDQKRKEIDRTGEDASQEVKQQLDEIERELHSLRQDLDKMDVDDDWERFKQNFEATTHKIAVSIDKLDGEVDDQPGKDPLGPG